MKKSFVFVALAAVIAMCATSCKKDESVLKFTATIESGDSKTTLEETDGYPRRVFWSEDDSIKVWGYGPGEEPTYASLGYVCKLTRGVGSTSAEFEVSTEDSRLRESSRFTAVYPVDAWRQTDQVYINSDQIFIPGNVLQYPMMAVSNNTHLQFKNVCGIMEVKLPRVSGTRLSGMKIKASHQISGDYIVAWNDGNPTLTPSRGLTEIEVSFPQVIDLSVETRPSVLVYLPAGNHPGINIEFYTTDFTYTKITASANSTIRVERSKITTLNFSDVTDVQIEWRPLPVHRNYFSVSDELQVDIANGNLVYGTGGNWFIAQNAWDVYGNFDYFKDLFHWSNGSDNSFGLTQTGSNFNFKDWGYLVTPGVNSGETEYSAYEDIATRWRTLTAQEWLYLTNSNDPEELGDFSNDTRDGLCYFVWVNDMTFTDIHRHRYNLSGILLMPDDWNSIQNHPTFESEEGEDDNFRRAKIDKSVLESCLEAGCAFIPTAGFTARELPTEIGGGGMEVFMGHYHLQYPYVLQFQSRWYDEDDVSADERGWMAWSSVFNEYWLDNEDFGIRYAVRLFRNAKYFGDDHVWHYYTGFDPNQNTGSAKGKRRK